MSKTKYHVTQDKKTGKWKALREGATRATSTSRTQREAINSARQHTRRAGGGELNIHGRDGKIRAKDTIPPAKDPFPPRG